jgi:hypothetical protein
VSAGWAWWRVDRLLAGTMCCSVSASRQWFIVKTQNRTNAMMRQCVCEDIAFSHWCDGAIMR